MAHDAVGVFQEVVEQSQLCHDVEQLVAVAARRDGVDQHEQRKADDHHAEQLHEVGAQELQALSAKSLQSRPHLVLHHQPVGTQEEEHGHAVVAEERQQVERQVPVGRRQDATQSAGVVLVEEVFVFANDARQPVAVVMQHDAQDGHTAQCVALSSCQKFRSHLYFFISQLSFSGHLRCACWSCRASGCRSLHGPSSVAAASRCIPAREC